MKKTMLLLCFLVSCSKSIEPIEPRPDEPLGFNSYIEMLSAGVVDRQIVVQGSVTTSDSCGNFYQSLVVEDLSGAMELRFSFYDIYSLFKFGEVISVSLKGKMLRYENGILCADMGSFAMASKSVLRQGYIDIVRAKRVEIPEIDSTLIGRTVMVTGGEFANGAMMPWSGEQRYVVGKESIVVYTTPYAKYANQILPQGKVSLRGVVTIFKGKFQLKLSSPSDCLADPT